MDTAIIMCRMDLNEIVSRNLKEQKTFCTFTRQKKAARDILFAEEFEAKETDHQLVKDLYEIWDNLNPRNMLEDWHDAEQIREEALQLFSHGIVDLKTRAEIEAMYWSGSLPRISLTS